MTRAAARAVFQHSDSTSPPAASRAKPCFPSATVALISKVTAALWSLIIPFLILSLTSHQLHPLLKCHKQQAAKPSLFLLLSCLKPHHRYSGGKEVFSLFSCRLQPCRHRRMCPKHNTLHSAPAVSRQAPAERPAPLPAVPRGPAPRGTRRSARAPQRSDPALQLRAAVTAVGSTKRTGPRRGTTLPSSREGTDLLTSHCRQSGELLFASDYNTQQHPAAS